MLPGEKYTPYVRLYIGFMTLLVFFTPILKVLKADVTLQYLTEILSGTLEIKEDAFLDSINENSNYEKQKGEYSRILEESVVDYLSDCLEKKEEKDYTIEKADVTWEEDEKSDQFGTMMGVTIYLKEKENLVTEEGISIQPITVEVFSGGEETNKEEHMQIKEIISEFYHLSVEDIVVKVIE